ncbi:MAG: MBL fold metallo-hydrolase RNA specificity domain-containing protein [Kiritimatiellia bacterium]|jgi:metallo-beta-lactamase family protein
MDLTFYGAAQTTTGSMHLVEHAGYKVLLDCGLVQGKRKESFELNRTMPISVDEIDAVILSHAHIDHSGRLPALVRQGYRGPIYATPATRSLADVMLRDSAFLQEKDVEYVNRRRGRQGKRLFELLYDQGDVEETMTLFRTLDYGRRQTVVPGLELTFNDAGHILGSATCTLDYMRDRLPRRLLFTGDLGQRNTPFLNDPVVVPDVDVFITECTYGDRNHPTRENVLGRLKDYVDLICQHKSKLVIPAFSVGRTQQIIMMFNELVENRRIPVVPVFVDSPLSKKATEIHRTHTECFNERTRRQLESGDDPFRFPGLRFTSSVEESMAINKAPGPMIIISASGMCEGGRILHHLKHTISHPMNVILITGFQASDTLGRKIVEREPVVKIFGEEHELRATVFTINELSAHADSTGLVNYAKALGPSLEHVFCVHGEPEYCEAHKRSLQEAGIQRVDVPVSGQRFQNV